MEEENGLVVRIRAEILESSPHSGWQRGKAGEKRDVRCMTFERYMSLCLYDERDGYYRSGQPRTGRQGDFYTSPAVGAVMASCVAEAFGRYAETCGEPVQAIEWGVGDGRLSLQLFDLWAESGSSARPYRQLLIEDHPGHVEAAKNGFVHRGASPAAVLYRTSRQIVHEFDELFGGHCVFLLANELLDAFPVHRVQRLDGELVELGVTVTEDGGFNYAFMPLSEPEIAITLERDGISLKEGQQTEVALAACRWIGELGRLKRGRLLLIDYGHEAEEYAAPHRMLGTLLCYSGHRATDEPFRHPGRQDMTAHVPFTSIRRAAERSGFRVVYYETQKRFLADYGALERLRDHSDADPFSEAARTNRAIRQLLLSDGMSETFKVMILDKVE
ncbi:class I SAM-dependent methyltransferase [Paenibacillus sp. NPDC058071]|uniref:class I SAM-dependent methyltransferase n=1 Tax=Paenibacillus sp. NPDC058071 TaxID=3346326 RepID=UPI0036D998D3